MQAIERHFFIKGQSGPLESIQHAPEAPDNRVLLVCHPHPLYQGSMENKIVTTLCRAAAESGITAYRFNYRGVGQSAGEYGHGVGESEDARAILAEIQQRHPDASILLAGFSFGGFVAYNIAASIKPLGVFLVSPSVEHFDMVALPEPLAPLMVLQGDQDDIVPYPAVVAWLLTRKCDYHFMKWAQVGHFFHGKLIEIKTEFKRWTHTLGERDGSTD